MAVADQQRERDKTAASYDPAKNGYRLANDPRCLFGWGPPQRGDSLVVMAVADQQQPDEQRDAWKPDMSAAWTYWWTEDMFADMLAIWERAQRQHNHPERVS